MNNIDEELRRIDRALKIFFIGMPIAIFFGWSAAFIRNYFGG